MANALLVAARSVSRNSGLNDFWVIGDSQGHEGGIHSTESQTQLTVESGGTFSNLSCIILSGNTLSTSLTVASRKNTANGAMSFSVVGAGSGEFTDSVNSDSVVAGDLYCVLSNSPSGSGSSTMSVMALQFNAVGNTCKKFMNEGWSIGNNITYPSIAGGNASTTETAAQLESEVAGTLKNMMVSVINNTRSTVTTEGTRINGVNGTLAVSIGIGFTGPVEDTVHSDSVNVTDKINSYASPVSGTGSLLDQLILGYDFVTLNSQWYLACMYASTTPGLSAGSTNYFPVGGSAIAPSATEADFQLTSRMAFTASNFGCNVPTNNTTTSSTVALRANGSTSALSISVLAPAGVGSTGIFEDNAHNVVIAATDKTNYIVVAGATSTLGVSGMWMVGVSSAISHFQTTGTQSTVAVSSKTVTPANNIAVGDLLVVRITGTVAAGGSPTFTVSDGTNTYTSAIRITNGVEATEEFYCYPALAVTSPVITVTPSASATLSFAFSEYSVTTGYTVTLDGTATGTGAALSTTWTTGACTVSGTLDLVCSIIGCLGAPSSLTTTSYADRYNAVAAGGDGIDCADLFTSANTTPAGTIGGGGLQNAAVVASYKATLASGTNYTRLIADNLALTDSTTRLVASFRVTSDNLATTDFTSRQGTSFRITSDNLAVADSTSRTTTSFRTASDNLAITDAASRSVASRRVASDNLALSDAVSRIVASLRSVADNLGVTDAVSRVASSFRLLLDNLAVADSLSRLAPAFRLASDKVGVNDGTASTRDQKCRILPPDGLGVTDQVARQSAAFRGVSDNLAATDLAARQVASLRKLIDNLGITDLVTVVDLPPGTNNWHVQISDSLALQDGGVNRLVASLRFLSDSLAVTDQTSRTASYLRLLADNVALADLVSSMTASRRRVSDNVAATDLTSRFVTFARLLQDGLGTSDALARVVAAYRSVSDAVGLQDAAKRVASALRLASDGLGLTDTLSRSTTYSRKVVDMLALADALTTMIPVTVTSVQITAVQVSQPWLDAVQVTQP